MTTLFFSPLMFSDVACSLLNLLVLLTFLVCVLQWWEMGSIALHFAPAVVPASVAQSASLSWLSLLLLNYKKKKKKLLIPVKSVTGLRDSPGRGLSIPNYLEFLTPFSV